MIVGQVCVGHVACRSSGVSVKWRVGQVAVGQVVVGQVAVGRMSATHSELLFIRYEIQ